MLRSLEKFVGRLSYSKGPHIILSLAKPRDLGRADLGELLEAAHVSR